VKLAKFVSMLHGLTKLDWLPSTAGCYSGIEYQNSANWLAGSCQSIITKMSCKKDPGLCHLKNETGLLVLPYC